MTVTKQMPDKKCVELNECTTVSNLIEVLKLCDPEAVVRLLVNGNNPLNEYDTLVEVFEIRYTTEDDPVCVIVHE